MIGGVKWTAGPLTLLSLFLLAIVIFISCPGSFRKLIVWSCKRATFWISWWLLYVTLRICPNQHGRICICCPKIKPNKSEQFIKYAESSAKSTRPIMQSQPDFNGHHETDISRYHQISISPEASNNNNTKITYEKNRISTADPTHTTISTVSKAYQQARFPTTGPSQLVQQKNYQNQGHVVMNRNQALRNATVYVLNDQNQPQPDKPDPIKGKHLAATDQRFFASPSPSSDNASLEQLTGLPPTLPQTTVSRHDGSGQDRYGQMPSSSIPPESSGNEIKINNNRNHQHHLPVVQHFSHQQLTSTSTAASGGPGPVQTHYQKQQKQPPPPPPNHHSSLAPRHSLTIQGGNAGGGNQTTSDRISGLNNRIREPLGISLSNPEHLSQSSGQIQNSKFQHTDRRGNLNNSIIPDYQDKYKTHRDQMPPIICYQQLPAIIPPPPASSQSAAASDRKRDDFLTRESYV